ncbi:MAG: NAD(P)H-binding protein [Bacteroidota bacterium]
MSSTSRIIVVGGTGLLGYHASLEFLRRGYLVTSLAIDDIDLEGWYPKEITTVTGDVFSMTKDELKAQFEGFYAMVYAVGPDDRTIPDAPAYLFFRKRLVVAAARVFEAAREAGVKRAVLLGSYLNYFNRQWPQLQLTQRHPYIKARAEQSEAVLLASGDEMETMVLELPYIFGTMPKRTPLWKDAFFDRLLKMNPVLYPDGGSSMVCAGNVAEAIAGAVELGEKGTMYAIGDQNMRWSELFSIMFHAIGVNRRLIHIPHWMAGIAGRFIMWRERRNDREPGLNLAYIFDDIISREYYLDGAQSAALLGHGSCDVRAAIVKTAKACYPDGFNRKRRNRK